jgi:ADP-ribose pyrophosphatase YjhB (NUDIX family)
VPIPDYVVVMRRLVGQRELWMPGVTAVVRREGPGGPGDEEVLMVRRADDGRWTPVTGILDPGEDAAVGAAREVLEETCVVARVDRLASTSVVRDVVYGNGDRASYLDLCFACTWVSGEAAVGDDESSEVRWFPRGALPDMDDHMRARVDAALADEQAARFTR